MLLHWRVCTGLCSVILLSSVVPQSGSCPATNLFSPDVARELDASIHEIVLKNNLPSVAVKVSAPGKGEYAFVEGYSNLEAHLARTLEPPFRIASITKPFAATAALILVDRGLLSKSDHIAKWYPQFPNANQITVDDLLRMRSGIPAPNDDEVLAQAYDAPLNAAPSLADYLARIMHPCDLFASRDGAFA
jgi:D-alanyl-D-alanine carboxypeptidase